MSMDSAKAFKTRFLEDKEFQKRFLALATAEERQSFLHSEGFDFTPEELAQVRQELSDDELAAVSGGKCCGATCEKESCTGYGHAPCRAYG